MTPYSNPNDAIGAALTACGLSSDFTAIRIGEDRGFTSCCYTVTLNDHTLVAKITAASHVHPKALRETEVLKTFVPVAQLPAPTCIGDHTHTDDGSHVLLMSHISGKGLNTTENNSDHTVMQSLKSMIPCWNTPIRQLPTSSMVSRWGTGTQKSEKPHSRRANRFKKRSRNFVREYAGRKNSAPEIPFVVDWIAEHFEECLEIAAKWTPTLIHGDLHPENIIVNQDQVTILDWQTASFGSPLLDITRLLIDGIPELSAEALIECTASVLSECDHYSLNNYHAQRTSASAIAAILSYAGFISGWGGKNILNMRPREQSLVKHHASVQGPTRLIHELIPLAEI